jgi:hypothetical protein
MIGFRARDDAVPPSSEEESDAATIDCDERRRLEPAIENTI